MTTDNQEYPCDFCKRDEGLKIVIGRNTVSAGISTATDLSGIYSLNDLKLQQKIVIDESLRSIFEDINKIKNKIAENNLGNLSKEWKALEEKSNFKKVFETGLILSDNTIMHNGAIVVNADFKYRKNPYYITKKQYGVTAKGDNGYVVKSLNPGYLYVYYEHAKKIDEYMISNNGFLKKINGVNDESILLKKEPCFSGDHLARSQTITIPKPEQATKLWLKYTEVKLSEKQKKIMTEKRSELMNCFDVKKMINGEVQDNCYLLTPEVYNCFTNIGDLDSEIIDNKSFNPSSFESELFFCEKINLSENEVKEVLNDDKKLRIKTGFLISIDDITSAVSELGDLIVGVSTDSYLTEEEVTAQMIMSIEASVKDQLSEYYYNEKIENDKFYNYNTEEQLKYLEASNTIQSYGLAENDWKEKYKIHINQDKFINNVKSFKSKEVSKKKIIEEIYGIWCVELLESNENIKYFKYFFEDGNIEHSRIYVECIAGMLQDAVASLKIMNWLTGKLTDKASDNNIVLNAFALNDDGIKQKLNSITDWRGVLWGDLLNTTKSTIEKVRPPFLEGFYRSYHHLVLISSGAIYAALHGLIEGKNYRVVEFRKTLAMISAVSGKNISEIHIKIVKNPSVFYDDLAKSITNALKGVGIESDYRKYKRQLRKTGLYEGLIKSGKTSYSVLAPVSKIENINKTTSILEVLDSLKSQPYYKFEKIEFNYVLNDLVIEKKLNSSIQFNVEAGLKALVHSTNTFFQVIGVLSVMDNINDNNYSTDVEGASRIVGGFWAVTLASIEAMDVVASRLRSVKDLKFNSNAKFRLITKNLKAFTLSKNFIKRFPIGIGFLTAGWDVWNGGNDMYGGKIIDGGITAISGGAIIGSLLVIGWVPGIGWGLLALGVGLSIVGLSIKENDMQIWLRRSLLGQQTIILGYSRYTSFSSFDEQQKNWNHNFAK